MPWPGAQGPASLRASTTLEEWIAALRDLDLEAAGAAPLVVRNKYRRAQKLYLLSWIDSDVVVASELTAFTALELALMRPRSGRDTGRPAREPHRLIPNG